METGGRERFGLVSPVVRNLMGCLALGAVAWAVHNYADAAAADPLQNKSRRPTWFLLDYAGPRDESGPPVLIYLDDWALADAHKYGGQATPQRAKISAESMQRVVTLFRKAKLWNTPLKAGESIAARPFQFTFGMSGKTLKTNLNPEQAQRTVLALKNEVLRETPGARVLADFANLYGWK